MILSHKHKFIFIKTTKTAGTSIEVYLSQFCGPDDIITPISPVDEKARAELGGKPQNYSLPKQLTECSTKELFYYVFKGRKPEKILFWNHMPAEKIKESIDLDVWNSYYKFTFVRNAWDRAISRYYWNLSRNSRKKDLNKSLQMNDPNSNWNIYTINDDVAVDFAGRFENIIDDMQAICSRLNLPFGGKLPRTKEKSRITKKPYKEILTPEQAQYIESRCAKEIELFNYKF
jgi:hypothetical protein